MVKSMHFLLDKNIERDTYSFLNLLASSISCGLRVRFSIPDVALLTFCVKTSHVDYIQIKHRLFTI